MTGPPGRYLPDVHLTDILKLTKEVGNFLLCPVKTERTDHATLADHVAQIIALNRHRFQNCAAMIERLEIQPLAVR